MVLFKLLKNKILKLMSSFNKTQHRYEYNLIKSHKYIQNENQKDQIRLYIETRL